MRILPYILSVVLSSTALAAPLEDKTPLEAMVSCKTEYYLVAPEDMVYEDVIDLCEQKEASDRTPLELLIGYPDLPSLDVPDDVVFTDNGSDILIINVWDYNHLDRDVHERIMSTVDEIVRKWDVSLIGSEGYYGPECFNYVAYPLPHSVGVDPLIESLAKIVDINDALNLIDRRMKRKERKRLLSEYASEVQRYPVSRLFSPRQLLKDEMPLFYDLKVHYRSYSAVDETLLAMKQQKQDKAIIVYGLGHYHQMNGYLDHLGISHIDVIIDRQQFDYSMSWQRSYPKLQFSTAKLEEYNTKIKPQIERKKRK